MQYQDSYFCCITMKKLLLCDAANLHSSKSCQESIVFYQHIGSQRRKATIEYINKELLALFRYVNFVISLFISLFHFLVFVYFHYFQKSNLNLFGKFERISSRVIIKFRFCAKVASIVTRCNMHFFGGLHSFLCFGSSSLMTSAWHK